MSSSLPHVIILVGPTASGKTELAIEIAEYFKTHIHNIDSRQIYKSMDIGTAKPSNCLLYTSPSPRDKRQSRMPSSA